MLGQLGRCLYTFSQSKYQGHQLEALNAETLLFSGLLEYGQLSKANGQDTKIV